MRCKKHPNDQSSTVGVCATCLRERLVAIVAAQTQAQLGSNSSRFNASWQQSEVGPASEADHFKNRNGGKFSSLLSGMFRSRMGPKDSGAGHSVSFDSCSGSPSWFSDVISSRRREISAARSLSLEKGSPSGGQRRKVERGRSFSGVGLCLSPLFRASPTRNCYENGGLLGNSTTSSCKSRSRNIVDSRRYGYDANR